MSMFRLKQAYCIRFHFRQILKYIEATCVETRCQGFSTAGRVCVMNWWKNCTHGYLRWITLLLFVTFLKNIITYDVSWAVYHFLRHASTELRVNFTKFLTAEVCVDGVALGQDFSTSISIFHCLRDSVSAPYTGTVCQFEAAVPRSIYPARVHVALFW
jgi:hypothetical protein